MSFFRIGRVPLALTLGFFIAFVLLPLGAMAWETVWGPDGFGFAAYRGILSDPIDRAQLAYSLELGALATAISVLLGAGFAWLTVRTDLPGGRWLAPLGIAPLVIPPVLVAMGFSDFADMAGFLPCAFLLGVSYAPFVAVLTARGLRAIDGNTYEAALLARGRGRAELMLLRQTLPEIAAGSLFAFLFVISEHGVPEFLTVKGKNWHTYAEGVFAAWKRRATGITHEDLAAPIVAAVPLVLIIGVALFLALRFRAHTRHRATFRELPVRELGGWRWPALVIPTIYLSAGVLVPVIVMGLWSAGSSDWSQPMSVDVMRQSFQLAFTEAGENLEFTLSVGAATAAVLVLISMTLAWSAARKSKLTEYLCVLPIAVPAILLAIGFVRVFNSSLAVTIYDHTFDFYDSPGIVIAAYAARFLPFGVLTLSAAVRRLPANLDEAASLTSGRGAIARALWIRVPLVLPAAWSAACLIFILAIRELDIAVVLPAGNLAVVRRLSNIVHYGGEEVGGALALVLLLSAVLIPLVTVLITGRRLHSLS